MSSKQTTVDFILEQIEGSGTISAKKMFGEYGIFCDGKIVALVCDDQLFVKKTNAGKSFLGNATEAKPYLGAKPCFLISGDRWEDRDWLTTLIKLSAVALPLPKKKAPASKKPVDG